MGSLEKRAYGSTDARVSVISVGGSPLFQSSFADGVATIHRALELGVNYFETSPYYAKGMAQAILGVALQDRPEQYLCAAKVGHFRHPARFRSLDALRTQMEENLRLLRRGSVDTLQAHEADMHCWWSDEPPLDGVLRDNCDYDFANAPIMRFLNEARELGLCRFIGITGNNADALARVLEHVDVDTFLPACNYDLLWRGVRRRALPVARRKGVALLLGCVFQSGVLIEEHPEWLETPPPWMTRPGYAYPASEVQDRLRRLYALKQESRLSLVALVIRYLLADAAINSIIIGAARPCEVEESVYAAQAGPLPANLHQAIEDLGLL